MGLFIAATPLKPNLQVAAAPALTTKETPRQSIDLFVGKTKAKTSSISDLELAGKSSDPAELHNLLTNTLRNPGNESADVQIFIAIAGNPNCSGNDLDALAAKALEVINNQKAGGEFIQQKLAKNPHVSEKIASSFVQQGIFLAELANNSGTPKTTLQAIIDKENALLKKSHAAELKTDAVSAAQVLSRRQAGQISQIIVAAQKNIDSK